MSTQTPPPAKKVKVSEAEVIDPHFLFRIKNIPGQDMVALIDHFQVMLKWLGNDRSPAPKTYLNMKKLNHLNFSEKKSRATVPEEGKNYYEKGPDFFTIIVDFIDKDFSQQDDDEKWVATIAYDRTPIPGHTRKVVPCSPQKTG